MKLTKQWLRNNFINDTIIEWYDNLDAYDKSKCIIIETVDTGIGTAIKVYLETKPGEGVWKDFTDYNSW